MKGHQRGPQSELAKMKRKINLQFSPFGHSGNRRVVFWLRPSALAMKKSYIKEYFSPCLTLKGANRWQRQLWLQQKKFFLLNARIIQVRFLETSLALIHKFTKGELAEQNRRNTVLYLYWHGVGRDPRGSWSFWHGPCTSAIGTNVDPRVNGHRFSVTCLSVWSTKKDARMYR